MADFLASLGLKTEPEPETDSGQCASLDELQSRLQKLLHAQVSPTRAAHVSTSLDLRGAARIDVHLIDSESEALGGQGAPNPSLGTVRATPANGSDGEPGHTVRELTASEALLNQPVSDPTLQQSVAKRLVSALGQVDSSSWVIREVSRQGQGWSFTFQCKGSMQHWMRQSGKGTGKAVICEYYQQEPEPAIDNRPAFDCRGTLTVAFPRNGRAISIKYEHTPIHSTVAELRQRFEPAPRPVPAKTSATSKAPKTPKTTKSTKDTNTPGTKKTGTPKQKKPRSSTAGEGSARSRKRQKGNDGKAQPSGEEASSLADAGTNAASNAAAASAAAQVPASGAVPVVSAAEAARRKKVANKLLSDAGVMPDTLSQEQFNIFANQSPELQKDSLEMLVKYGAERLQIIHPAANPAPAEAGKPAPNMDSTRASATGDLTTKELAPSRNSLPKSRQSGGSNSVGANAPKMGKSRLACYQCKERRVKCPRDRPTCPECASNSRSCAYPPQKARASRSKKAQKSEEVVVDDDGDDDEEDEVAEEEGEEEEDEEEEVEQVADETQPQQSWQGDSHPQASTVPPPSNWQMPVADMLDPAAVSTAPEPHRAAGNHYTSTVPAQVQGNHQSSLSAASGLASLQAYTHGNPASAMDASGSARSFAGQNQGIDPAAIHQGRRPQPNLHADHSSAGPVNVATGATQGMSQPQPGQTAAQGRHRRTSSSAPREKAQQAASLQQSRPQQGSPRATAAAQVQHRASPLQQEIGRTHPRQSNRAQSRTPVNDGRALPPSQSRGSAMPDSSSARDATGRSRYNHMSTNAAASAASEHIPYQPYMPQDVNNTGSSSLHPGRGYGNAAVSYPSAVPATTATSAYPPPSTASQWSRNSSQASGGERALNHASAGQTSSNPYGTGSGGQHGQGVGGTNGQNRGYQQYTSQQNAWLGVNGTNTSGSYNNFQSYWSQ